jgi:hypothetical protein
MPAAYLRASRALRLRAVDFLDVDPTFLNGLEGVCVLYEATGGLLRVGIWSICGQFHEPRLIVSNAS